MAQDWLGTHRSCGCRSIRGDALLRRPDRSEPSSRTPESRFDPHVLRTGGPCTRLDLEREARLGRAVVTDRLSTLAAFGLVDEGDVGRSIGGRAPRLVRFRSEAARILVANIDRDTISLGLADLDGQLVLEHYEDFDAGLPAHALFDRLEALFDWSLDKMARRCGRRSGTAGRCDVADSKAWRSRSFARCLPGTMPDCWNV